MKQKLINVYRFNELKKDVKEKVINYFRANNDYCFLNDDLNEQLKELLKKHKIKSDDFKLFYSLSYCQGDGLCFIGYFDYKGFSFSVNHSGHYYHKNSTDIYLNDYEDYIDNFEEQDNLKEMVIKKLKDNAEKEFKEIYYKICDELEKRGYDYIEYEDSEENIKEIIKINDYTFRENGEIEN